LSIRLLLATRLPSPAQARQPPLACDNSRRPIHPCATSNPKSPRPPSPARPPKTSRRNALAAVAAIFAAYAAALLYAQGRTPPGLNNDVAEEALRAVYLVQGHHFEVITFAVGNSPETLYLYLVGAMIQ
jgi:hypothetical protein